MLAGVPSETVSATLTGNAATEAVKVYVGLANLNARFDGRRVAEAIRSARGRTRLLATVAVRALTRRGVGTSPRRPRSRSRRVAAVARVRRSGGRSAPERPEPHGAGSQIVLAAQEGR